MWGGQRERVCVYVSEHVCVSMCVCMRLYVSVLSERVCECVNVWAYKLAFINRSIKVRCDLKRSVWEGNWKAGSAFKGPRCLLRGLEHVSGAFIHYSIASHSPFQHEVHW